MGVESKSIVQAAFLAVGFDDEIAGSNVRLHLGLVEKEVEQIQSLFRPFCVAHGTDDGVADWDGFFGVYLLVQKTRVLGCSVEV